MKKADEKDQKRQRVERSEWLMKKGTYIGIVALVLATIGVLIALAAYFKNRTNYLYDEDDFMFDDPENMDFYLNDSDDYYMGLDDDFEEDSLPIEEKAK